MHILVEHLPYFMDLGVGFAMQEHDSMLWHIVEVYVIHGDGYNTI